MNRGLSRLRARRNVWKNEFKKREKMIFKFAA